MIQQSFGTSEKTNKFADSGQMLVIVFSDEETQVEKINRLLKAGVECCMRDHGFVKVFKEGNKTGSFSPKSLEDSLDVAGVVVCCMCFLILEIGSG